MNTLRMNTMPSTSFSSRQINSSPRQTAETLADVQGWEAEIRGQVARLVVTGETGITVPVLANARPLIPSRSLIVDASDYCDVAGHCAAPDTLRLQVDRRSHASVHCTD